MIISLSNVLTGVVPAINVGANAGQVDANITDPDFSAVYVSSGAVLELSFGVTNFAKYIAIAGHNLAGGTVEILDGVTLLKTVNLTRNNTVMITDQNASYTDLTIRLTAVGGDPALVSFIAAGTLINVPNNGEQAGYSRNWLNRPLKQKTSVNSLASPTAIVNKRVPLAGRLSIPNASTAFSQGQLQEFYDFIETQPFFIKEIDTNDISSYVCFNPKWIAPKAHGGTRALDVVSFSFRVSNGL